MDKTGRDCFHRFYTRFFSDRDFNLFEVLHWIMALPYVFTSTQTDYLSVRGGRRLKACLASENTNDMQDAEYVDLKNAFDKFDERLAPLTELGRDVTKEELKCLSLFHFYSAYATTQAVNDADGTRYFQIRKKRKWKPLRVNPYFPKTHANPEHLNFENWARTAVMAYTPCETSKALYEEWDGKWHEALVNLIHLDECPPWVRVPYQKYTVARSDRAHTCPPIPSADIAVESENIDASESEGEESDFAETDADADDFLR